MKRDLGTIRKKIGGLRRERYYLENKLLNAFSRKRLIAGTPVEKYKKCNKGNCRCTKGELHGPTYYISRKEGPKTKMIYIRHQLWPEVKEKVSRYQQWRQARARMVQINREIFSLIDQIEKAITVEAKKKR
jgi:hypothetical protein